MNDDKLYELSVDDLDEIFLCHAIEGFEGLWEDYTNSYSTISLESIISVYFRLPRYLSNKVAPLVRKHIKGLVPTSMTVLQLEMIIQDHIKTYLSERFGVNIPESLDCLLLFRGNLK